MRRPGTIHLRVSNARKSWAACGADLQTLLRAETRSRRRLVTCGAMPAHKAVEG